MFSQKIKLTLLLFFGAVLSLVSFPHRALATSMQDFDTSMHYYTTLFIGDSIAVYWRGANYPWSYIGDYCVEVPNGKDPAWSGSTSDPGGTFLYPTVDTTYEMYCVSGGVSTDIKTLTIKVLPCGDGKLDSGEYCDHGTSNGHESCGPTSCDIICHFKECLPPPAICGDGVTDPGEACDDGAANNDSCPANCSHSCKKNNCVIPTAFINVNPTSIIPGGNATLHWESTDAVSCTASSTDSSWTGPVATSGDTVVSPAATNTYSVFCTSATGVKSLVTSDTLTVDIISPTIDFKANPGLINTGGSSILKWTVTNAVSCVASSVDPNWSGSVSEVGGTKSVSPPATVTYLIKCTSVQGGVTEQTTQLLVASVSCNNGVLEAGEQCDQGLNGNGVCPFTCSQVCTLNNCPYVPPSTACDNPAAICKNECDTTTEVQVGYCNTSLSKCCLVQTATPNNQSTDISNPLNFNDVQGVLDATLSSLQAIIAILAIIALVIGGIFYITAAGDEGRIKTAKSTITVALVGLAIGIAAPSFLKQIGDILGWGALPAPTAKTLTEIAFSTLNFLLSVVGIIGIIMLVVGGIVYLTSAGDEKRIEEGKNIIRYAIIGIAIALAALIIVTQMAKFFV